MSTQHGFTNLSEALNSNQNLHLNPDKADGIAVKLKYHDEDGATKVIEDLHLGYSQDPDDDIDEPDTWFLQDVNGKHLFDLTDTFCQAFYNEGGWSLWAQGELPVVRYLDVNELEIGQRVDLYDTVAHQSFTNHIYVGDIYFSPVWEDPRLILGPPRPEPVLLCLTGRQMIITAAGAITSPSVVDESDTRAIYTVEIDHTYRSYHTVKATSYAEAAVKAREETVDQNELEYVDTDGPVSIEGPEGLYYPGGGLSPDGSDI